MGKILITGTGRAGTTFLTNLLTHLGLDTGVSLHECRIATEHPWHAGLDTNMSYKNHIVKNVDAALNIDFYVTQKKVDIEHVIIPVRHLHDATNSRVNQANHGYKSGGWWGRAVTDFKSQEEFLLRAMYGLIYDLTVHNIPYTTIYFPRFLEDPKYLKEKLNWLIGDIPDQKFYDMFKEIAHPEFITQHHDTDSTPKQLEIGWGKGDNKSED